jgi:hypothetical protein
MNRRDVAENTRVPEEQENIVSSYRHKETPSAWQVCSSLGNSTKGLGYQPLV